MHLPGRTVSNLRSRLIAMSLVGMIPALGTLLYMQRSERAAATSRTLDDTLRLTRLAAIQQASLFDGAQRMLLTLSQIPAIRGGDPAECDRMLGNVLQEHHGVSRLFVFDANGSRICASQSDLPHNGNVQRRSWFQRAMATRE